MVVIIRPCAKQENISYQELGWNQKRGGNSVLQVKQIVIMFYASNNQELLFTVSLFGMGGRERGREFTQP